MFTLFYSIRYTLYCINGVQRIVLEGGRAASPNGISHANHDGERKMVMIFDHNDEDDVWVQQGINENMVKNDGNLFQNLYFFYVAKKEIQSRKFTESLSIYHSEFCLS